MCDKCREMEELVISDSIDLELIQKLVDEEKIDLYAANCYPNELLKYMDRGNHYTMNTYYHCKQCDKFYYVGFCLYGLPIIEEVEKNEILHDVLRLEWGYVGTYFKNGVTMPDAKYAIKNEGYIIAPVWECLIDAFGYGTATPVQALISALKILYNRIRKDGMVKLKYPAENTQMIDSQNFDEIIKMYFTEYVLNEVKK